MVPFNAVFGEPLRKSLKYASVAISMAGEDGKQYVWGYVPIIVAKTGLFLKENATEVEGVFRIAGSQKRMRELQEIFDTAPRYGKHLTWDNYSVHDCASVLRRYLNQMPEPIVPLDLYNEFRNVMSRKPVDDAAAIKTYRLLTESMPPANRYLLLYVLDLLAVFARKSDINLMPASNLAVIFQPGIFSHPSHLTDANEHKLAVEVLQFLIEHQDHFVLAVSPPAPTNIESADLTSVSRPAEPLAPDVAELSDSDEEFGELIVHEGGGAKLARRSTTNESKSKRRGLFSRSRKTPTPPEVSKRPATADAQPEPIAETGKSKAREPPSPKGEIHEVGIRSGTKKEDTPLPTKVGVRRSKTVPSRKAKEQNGQRSVSASKASPTTAITTSAPAEELTTHTEETTNPPVETQTSPPTTTKSDIPAIEPDLPTPPNSKHLDNPVTAQTS
ncbi:RhoGAP-domain-containing protein [Meira miltonrushii]|uniref:RhoGAP-domain-containing protein n=1 Tax=Meira miltonrushii TaxID=1280837 RepID=A0A316V7L1_9BASI|nr:RhoGAP-domain-containing protein [Meira miltonrushii]PWN33008.1 RhoGAP-domain-containing protein [Meira miltonrushii]